MAQPSRRLTLLKKFERQVAPLERYQIDFLGLGEDTRLQIAHLEKILERKQKGSLDATPPSASHNLARYGAAVGDEEAFDGQKGDGAKRAENLSLDLEAREQERKGGGLHGGGGEEFGRAKARFQRAKSLRDSGSSSRWYHVFSRSRRRGDHAAPPSPSPPSPSKPPTARTAQTQPRRRLSKAHRAGKSGRANIPFTPALESNDTPYIHPDQRGNWGSVLHTRTEAMDRQ
ncbi:MAG: hypothetical protein Q9171_003036 [Xanthocarpia ochracea]